MQDSRIAFRTGTVGRAKMTGRGIGGRRKRESTHMYGAYIAVSTLFGADYFQLWWGSGGSVGPRIDDYTRNWKGGWDGELRCGRLCTSFRYLEVHVKKSCTFLECCTESMCCTTKTLQFKKCTAHEVCIPRLHFCFRM